MNESINQLIDKLPLLLFFLLVHSFPQFSCSFVPAFWRSTGGSRYLFTLFVRLFLGFKLFFYFKARLPVKWMPPESLFYGESTTMSDV